MDQEDNEMPSIYDHTLKSKESLEEAKLVIKNQTKRPVDILWINFASKLIRYKTLRSGEEFHLSTFKTHPWIFRDYFTGVLMHVKHKEVFWPKASTEEQPIQLVHIHYPLHSLKLLSLWATVVRIKNINEIAHMDIPHTLRTDLGTLFRLFLNHHVMLAQTTRRRQPISQ